MISKTNPLNFEAIGAEGIQVATSYSYVQQFLSTTVLRLQVQSNTEPVVQLIGENETTAITPEKVASRSNVTYMAQCYLKSYDLGMTSLYFDILPFWAVTGASVTITDGANDGTYILMERVYDDTLNTFVCNFMHSYAASAYQPFCETTHGGDEDVWQCVISLSGLSGCYRVSIDGVISNYFEVISEDLRHIRYRNSDNNFATIYDTGITFALDIDAELFTYSGGGEDEVYIDDEQQEVRMDSCYYRNVEFQTFGIPNWMVEKLNLIFSHDDVEIDGIGFQVAEKGSAELIEGTNLFIYTINLQQTSDKAIDEGGFILMDAENYLLINAANKLPYG